MRPPDALGILERFLDQALLTNTSPLRIVHGKGTGALRNLVKEKLSEYPVKIITQDVDEQGGSGATIVEW